MSATRKQKRTTARKRTANRSARRFIDRDTRAWIRNASDRDAFENHRCIFHVGRAAYAVWWIEKHCRLYEGTQAGEPLILRGCKECGMYGIETPDEFIDAGLEQCLDRA